MTRNRDSEVANFEGLSDKQVDACYAEAEAAAAKHTEGSEEWETDFAIALREAAAKRQRTGHRGRCAMDRWVARQYDRA